MTTKAPVIAKERVRKPPRLLDLEMYLPKISNPSEFTHLKEIALYEIPIPISENKQHTVKQIEVVRNGKLKIASRIKNSRQANWFINQMRGYGLRNTNQLAMVRAWMGYRPNSVFELEIVFHWKSSRVWTKDGRPKKIDGHNYKKLLIDCTAQLLGYDDSYFFKSSVEKRTNEKESVTIWVREYFVGQ